MSGKGLYDHIRLKQHAALVAAVADGRGAQCVPLHVRVEPTESCNFSCQFCIWHDPERRKSIEDKFDGTGKRHLDEARFLEIIDELASMGTQAISFTGAGDPLVHASVGKVLRRIRKHNMAAGVTSNLAMRLKSQTLDELAQCRWLRWSMNGGSKQTYLRVNRPRSTQLETVFERACDNVREVAKRIAATASRTDFNASFIVHESNQHDVYQAAQLARTLGLASIAFRPDTPFERDAEPLRYADDVAAQMQRARNDFEDADFKVHFSEERLSDVARSEDDSLVCHYANHSTYLAANGDVYPCCYTRYDRKYVMGNVNDQSFAEFWNSEARQHFYQHLQFNLCPSCPHGSDNRFLQALANKQISPAEVSDESSGQSPVPDPFV